MFKKPFSFDGRIRITEYGFSLIISAIAYVILALILGSLGNEVGAIIFLISLLPLLWFRLAQGAKRCHDVGKSGFWQIIPFYALWLIFQDGEPGPNQYGENPKEFKL